MNEAARTKAERLYRVGLLRETFVAGAAWQAAQRPHPTPEDREQLAKVLAVGDPDPYDGDHFDRYYRSLADAVIAAGWHR